MQPVFGSRSGPTKYWVWSGSKLFATKLLKRACTASCEDRGRLYFFSHRQPCFWCMGSKNICETTLKRKLIWAFAVRICDKYLNLWLIYIEMWNVILGPQNISKPVVPIFQWQSIKLWKFTSSSTVWILKCSLNHNAIVCLRPPKPYSSWKIIIKW